MQQYNFEVVVPSVFLLPWLFLITNYKFDSFDDQVNTKTLQFNKWMYVVFTWQQEIGAELYINSIKLSEDPKGKTTNLSTQSSVTPKKKIIKKYQHLLIGTSLKGGLEGTVKFFYFASLTILYQHVDKDMADEMMVFFWNNGNLLC